MSLDASLRNATKLSAKTVGGKVRYRAAIPGRLFASVSGIYESLALRP
jgi:hypothetical protein